MSKCETCIKSDTCNYKLDLKRILKSMTILIYDEFSALWVRKTIEPNIKCPYFAEILSETYKSKSEMCIAQIFDLDLIFK